MILHYHRSKVQGALMEASEIAGVVNNEEGGLLWGLVVHSLMKSYEGEMLGYRGDSFLMTAVEVDQRCLC